MLPNQRDCNGISNSLMGLPLPSALPSTRSSVSSPIPASLSQEGKVQHKQKQAIVTVSPSGSITKTSNKSNNKMTKQGDDRVQHDYHDYAAQELPTRMVPQTDRQLLTFPMKLFKALERAEQNQCAQYNLSKVVSWQPHGRCFKVHEENRAIVVQKFLKPFMNMDKWSTFQRSLCLYGFKRITKSTSPDQNAYYHAQFLRGREYWVTHVQRSKSGQGKRLKSNPDAEPDFYNMPYVQPLDTICNNKTINKVPKSTITAPSVSPTPPPAMVQDISERSGHSSMIMMGQQQQPPQPLQSFASSPRRVSMFGAIGGSTSSIVPPLQLQQQQPKERPMMPSMSLMQRQQQQLLMLQQQVLQQQQMLIMEQQQQLLMNNNSGNNMGMNTNHNGMGMMPTVSQANSLSNASTSSSSSSSNQEEDFPLLEPCPLPEQPQDEEVPLSINAPTIMLEQALGQEWGRSFFDIDIGDNN